MKYCSLSKRRCLDCVLSLKVKKAIFVPGKHQTSVRERVRERGGDREREREREGGIQGKTRDLVENVRGFDFAATEKRLSRQQWKLNCAAY